MPILEVVVAAAFSKPWAGIKMPGPLVCKKRADHSPQKAKREHIRPHLTLYKHTEQATRVKSKQKKKET